MPMKQFRQRLDELAPNIPARTINELEQISAYIVPLYLGKEVQLRPSAAAREMKAFAKSLRRATTALERLGKQGMMHIHAASQSNRDFGDLDHRSHVEYMERMARSAERAAETASDISKSELDHKGGPQPDKNLRNLVVILMDRYQELLPIQPTHTVDPATGLGESLFDIFVKSAVGEFAPDGIHLEPRKIDDAITWALSSRDLEYFTPPRFLDE